MCIGSNISSTESDRNILKGKAGTAIDKIWTIWKSGFSDKIKQEFFTVLGVSIVL